MKLINKGGIIDAKILRGIFPDIVTQEKNHVQVFRTKTLTGYFINCISDTVKTYSFYVLKGGKIYFAENNLLITTTKKKNSKKINTYYNEFTVSTKEESIILDIIFFDKFSDDTCKIAPKMIILKSHQTKEIVINDDRIDEKINKTK